jgi:hypothetical protein
MKMGGKFVLATHCVVFTNSSLERFINPQRPSAEHFCFGWCAALAEWEMRHLVVAGATA